MKNHNLLAEIVIGEGVTTYQVQGAVPVVVYIHGFRSNGRGTKAESLARCAHSAGFGFVSFDQHGCGSSKLPFHEFTISGALADVTEVVNHLAPAPVVLVGSSLGGVLGVAVAPLLGPRLHGMLLIAPAFGLLKHHFDRIPSDRLNDWQTQGTMTLHDEYSGCDYGLDYTFYQDAQRYRNPLTTRFGCPVVVVHGEKDELLPVEDSVQFAADIDSPQTSIFVVPEADHRANLALPLICRQVVHLCQIPP